MSERIKGATSVSLEFRLTDSTTGAPKPAVDVTTLSLQWARPGAAASTATALTLLGSQAAVWLAFGAIEQDATHSPGVYRVDCPTAAFATGADEVVLTVTGSGIQAASRLVDLVTVDLRSVGGGVIVTTNSDKTGYGLAAAGLDSVVVEAGVNARQALSPILAACAGVVSGMGTGTVVIKGGAVSTTRITASTDSVGNRTSVTLAPPA